MHGNLQLVFFNTPNPFFSWLPSEWVVCIQTNTVLTNCVALHALLASTTDPASLRAALLQQQCVTAGQEGVCAMQVLL